MKLSTPPVNPSARPRYSEKDPKVTINAGIRPRVIRKPFKLPPRAQDERQEGRPGNRQPAVAQQLAEDDRRQPHE